MSRAGWIAVSVIVVSMCAMFTVVGVAASTQAHLDMQTCLDHGGRWIWHLQGGNYCEGNR